METHHIHGVETGFRHGTDAVHSLFKHENSRHEFERHLDAAEKHDMAHFYVDGHKYKLTHQEHDGKTIPVVETSHHH